MTGIELVVSGILLLEMLYITSRPCLGKAAAYMRSISNTDLLRLGGALHRRQDCV
jgi:hypothetical protein